MSIPSTKVFSVSVGISLEITYWFVLPVAIVLIGAKIRFRSKEKLLRDEFGEAYESYAREDARVVSNARMAVGERGSG